MSAVHEDIRSEFLAEAGELVATLGEQLVELERQPKDPELLNAIFRGFHTIKGGAGFIQLGMLAELCHRAEEVFGALRAGKREVDAGLLDVSLAALDCMQAMLEQVGAGGTPAAAPDSLLRDLEGLLGEPASATISDDEFEALLDQLHGAGQVPAAVVEPPAPPPAPVAEAVVPTRRASDGDGSIRVDTARLDSLMNLVGELVLVRNRLKTLHPAGSLPLDSERSLRELDALTKRLQGSVLNLRLQPAKKLFSRFPKLVRDIARSVGKEIELVLEGEDTDLDKNLIEALADPLLHMVRNSCDHGIETPEVRLAAGKPRAGRLSLSARQNGDRVQIEVRDDGAGIDPERLRRKAVEKGLISAEAAAYLDSQAALELILLPGFSTKDQVSDLSGRGVGMDVVKSRIVALRGSVGIESVVGVGSCLRLSLPLTLAIAPVLMTTLGTRLYAIPLDKVREVAALRPADVEVGGERPYWRHRGERLPMMDLSCWLDPAEASLDGDRHVAVVQLGERRAALVVHRLRGCEEVVVKPLGAMLRGLAGFAGATVTGDGRVALVLDVDSLAQAHDSGLAAAGELSWT
ncbi:MAG: chemotaxis protein CheA [Stagnimonas sp.]|nr:chemotaxis protein CheA [Stagnimonas sp.]